MIRKIISGGRGSIEQAALDLAVKLEIPHKGWVPKGTGTDRIDRYHLTMDACDDEISALEKNAKESQGTLILYNRKMPEILQTLKKILYNLDQPILEIDLSRVSKFECALNINRWITENRIEVLHVSGERSEKQGACPDATDILESVLYLGQVEQSKPLSAKLSKPISLLPHTVDEAVTCLETELPLKDKVTIANMTIGELPALNLTLGKYIRESFGMWAGNTALVNSCMERSGKPDIQIEDTGIIIIQALWEKLKGTHRLRLLHR